MPQQDSQPQPERQEAEDRLNSAIHAMMTSPPGLEVMKWLRRITIETVAGPEVSNKTLRHLEGQRFIVGLLETRKLMHIQREERSLGRSPQPNPDRPRARASRLRDPGSSRYAD
jgi:hypothetical protein